jgi:hypothetical protein
MNEKSKKLDFVNKHLDEYFYKWLIADINKLLEKRLEFTLPYILLVSTGIDFLGGLTDGFHNNSNSRSNRFIKIWMGKVNPLYKADGMSELLYNNVRCGASHQAIYKEGVACSYSLPVPMHLQKITTGYKDIVIIQVLQYAEDFIKAQDLYIKEYIRKKIDIVYENLSEMLNLTLNDIGNIGKTIITGTSEPPPGSL